MSFMALMDFKSSVGAGADSYLPLRVEKDVDVIPDMDISVTKLNKVGNSRFNHFFSNGYGGITFKVTALLKTSDVWNNESISNILQQWYENMTPLSIVTDAIDIPDDEYIITKNPSRKQHYKTSTEWELEFTTYTPLILFKYKNDNSRVLNALKKNKAKKKSSKKKNALSKCNYKTLVYSKKKKVVKCVKTLQTILKKKKYYTGKLDGWFGKETTKAVKKFQKAYNKKNVKTVTTNGYTGIKVNSGKLITNTKNNSNISLPKGTKITKNSSKNKSTVVKAKGINKILPTNGKVDKATYNQLIKL